MILAYFGRKPATPMLTVLKVRFRFGAQSSSQTTLKLIGCNGNSATCSV